MIRKLNRKKILISIFLFIAGIVVIMCFFHQQIQKMIGSYLVVEDDLHLVDIIHVIAGDDYRTDYAIQLYKQGYAKYIFFTGGWCKYHGYYHGQHGLERALSQGIPAEAIVFDDTDVTSTYDETLLLKTWIDQNAELIHSVIVVSDPFHMRRARWTTRFLLPDGIEILMAPVPFVQTPYTSQWWKDEQSKRYVQDEYLKMGYYILRYKFSIGWLASLDSK